MADKPPSRLHNILVTMLGVLNLRQRRIQELSLLNEASRAIIRAELDVDALCELVYQQSSKVLDTSWFHLALFEELNYVIKIRVQNGQRLPSEVFNLGDNEGLMGWMRRTGRALLVEDFQRELPHLPAQPRYQAEHPPRSGIYVPLLAGDTVIGTISVQSSRPRHFDANDLRFLSLIADGAASAIAKARAYDALQTRITQLQLISEVGRQAATYLDLDRLLPSVVRLIRDTFGYFAVHVFMVDEQRHQLQFRASTAADIPLWRGRDDRFNYDQGIIGAVARSREVLLVNDVRQEPRFIPDLPGTQSELAVPLTVGERLLAVLDVQSDRRNAFDDNDRFVLQTLAAQLAVAIDAADAYTQQQQEAWTLAALLETAKNIASASALDDLLATIVRLPGVLVGCDRVAVWQYARDHDAFVPVAVWGWPAEARAALLRHELPAAAAPLLDDVRKSGLYQRVDDLAADPEKLPAVATYCGSGQLLALPLLTRATVLGVLLLDADQGSPRWSPSQITIAVGIANQAVGAMESALLAQAAAEQDRLAQEIRVAREIQTDLLPSAVPQLPGWDIAAAWRSARAVGGDFYDFWTLPGPQLGLVIADVSDKGVPAALFMALSRSLMRAAALDGSDPCHAVERANRWITRDSQSGMFVTLFYGLIDPQSGNCVYTNAGHNPPLLISGVGKVCPLTTPGIALGVIEDAQFHMANIVLEPGDVLICYTDGITEAIDGSETEYGVARLTALVQKWRTATADEIVQAILADLLVHTGDLPAFDDVTLVVVKRNAVHSTGALVVTDIVAGQEDQKATNNHLDKGAAERGLEIAKPDQGDHDQLDRNDDVRRQ